MMLGQASANAASRVLSWDISDPGPPDEFFEPHPVSSLGTPYPPKGTRLIQTGSFSPRDFLSAQRLTGQLPEAWRRTKR